MKYENGLMKKLLNITWPIFIEQLLFMLLGSMDIFMLGRFSDNAVGAVGIVNQIIGMLTLMFGIITLGTTILCAQYIGAKRSNCDMIRLVFTSIMVNLVLGVIISILLSVFSDSFLKFMNVAPELYDYSSSYIKIVGGFILIQALTMTFSAILRSFGCTKICMTTTFIMNLINVVFNYILIFGNFGFPKLGVTGAAISTTLSKIVGGIILGYILFTKVLPKFHFKYLKESLKPELKNIFLMGAPSAGEQISYSTAKIVTTIILTHISIAAVTTNSYINNICMFIYVFATSIGEGTAILVGRLVGDGNNDAAHDLCLSSFKKAFVISSIMACIVAFLGKNIFGIFTTNAEIIDIGTKVLFVNIFLEIGRTFNVVIINSLRAAGDVRFPVYIGICSMWTVGVLLAYFLSITLNLGMPGMWMALALDEWTRGIIMYKRWTRKKWYGKALVTK